MIKEGNGTSEILHTPTTFNFYPTSCQHTICQSSLLLLYFLTTTDLAQCKQKYQSIHPAVNSNLPSGQNVLSSRTSKDQTTKSQHLQQMIQKICKHIAQTQQPIKMNKNYMLDNTKVHAWMTDMYMDDKGVHGVIPKVTDRQSKRKQLFAHLIGCYV